MYDRTVASIARERRSCAETRVSLWSWALTPGSARRAAFHGCRNRAWPVRRNPRSPVSRSITSRSNRFATDSTDCECRESVAQSRMLLIENQRTMNAALTTSASTALAVSVRRMIPPVITAAALRRARAQSAAHPFGASAERRRRLLSRREASP
jgi:hypothetical protein